MFLHERKIMFDKRNYDNASFILDMSSYYITNKSRNEVIDMGIEYDLDLSLANDSYEVLREKIINSLFSTITVHLSGYFSNNSQMLNSIVRLRDEKTCTSLDEVLSETLGSILTGLNKLSSKNKKYNHFDMLINKAKKSDKYISKSSFEGIKRKILKLSNFFSDQSLVLEEINKNHKEKLFENEAHQKYNFNIGFSSFEKEQIFYMLSIESNTCKCCESRPFKLEEYHIENITYAENTTDKDVYANEVLIIASVKNQGERMKLEVKKEDGKEGLFLFNKTKENGNLAGEKDEVSETSMKLFLSKDEALEYLDEINDLVDQKTYHL